MRGIPSKEKIEELISARASEDIGLEFKAAPWEPNDGGKRECLKDITAIANTEGGLILVGIEEVGNAADKIKPLSPADAELTRSRVNDLLQAGVEPRLYGVNVQTVDVGGGVVLAIDIPRSTFRPHRVTSQGWNKFWLRNPTSAYEANVTDLRRLFMQSAEFGERAERYHATRVADALNHDVVSNLANGPHSLVLHIIPSDAFSLSYPVNPKMVLPIQASFKPIGKVDGWSARAVADGYLLYRGGPECHGYTLVRKNGIVEAVRIKVTEGTQLSPTVTEARLAHPTFRYCKALQSLGVQPPYYAFATLSGVGGMELSVAGDGTEDSTPITRTNLTLPPTLIEDISDVEAVGAAFQPAFDTIWNAGGYLESRSFATGKWVSTSQE